MTASITTLPEWSARIPAPKPSGRYPLALEAVGAGMVARHIFPGFTNATREARYFSFLSWVFWTFDEYRANEVPRDRWPLGQHRWRVRLEHALRCCTQLRAFEETGQRARGLVGVLKTPDLRDLPVDEIVPLGGKRVEKIVTAFDPAFYGSPFVALGFGVPRDGRIQLSELGAAAGEAFERSLHEGAGFRQRTALNALMNASARLTVGELRTLADTLRIRPLVAGEPEHTVMVRVLFRLDAVDQQPPPFDAEDRSRRLGLARILDVVNQSNGQVTEPVECHAIFATRAFGDGTRLRTDDPLDFPDAVWQRYEERQHQKLAVSAFWHEALEFLVNEHAPPQPASAIVAHCTSLLERSVPLTAWLGEHALSLTANDASARVMVRTRRRNRSANGVCHRLTRKIQNVRGDIDVGARLGRALVSLLLTVAAWREVELPAEERVLHQEGGATRLSLAWVADELAKRGDRPLREIVRWLLECCVLSQAIRVAYEKTDSAGRVNRFFIERGDGGYRIVQVQPLAGRLPFDASRLDGAFGLLKTLQLLGVRADGSYYVTVAGKKTLAAVLGPGVPIA